jgi:hypothetical protein
MNSNRKRPGRTLIITSLIGIGLISGVAAWKSHRDAEPVIQFPPDPVLPSPNAFDFYAKAGEMHETLLKKTPNSRSIDSITDFGVPQNLTPQQLAKRYPVARKEAWLRTNAKVLRTLRQGFQYSYYPNPRVGSEGRVYADAKFNTNVSHLARLLRIESNVHVERKDWTRASQSMLDLLRLGHDMLHGGPLMSLFQSTLLNDKAFEKMETLIPNLDAKTTRTAASTIEQLYETRTRAPEILTKTKWSDLKESEYVFTSPNWRTEYSNLSIATRTMLQPFLGTPSTEELIRDKAEQIQTRLNLERYSKRILIDNYTHFMDEVIANAQRPYPAQQKITPPSDPFNELRARFVLRSKIYAPRQEAITVLLYVSLALRAYKLEYGNYPHTLQELPPKYLKKIPADPFGSGEPLHYRKTEKSYLLYSIGPDGKDNGGKPIDNPKGTTQKTRRRISSGSLGDVVSPYTPQ